MKQIISIIIVGFFLVILSGCKSASSNTGGTNVPGTTPTVIAKGNPGTGAYLAINEIGVGPNGYVSLTNFTDQPANLAGLSLCQGSKCFELPDATVEAGKTVRIAAGDGAGIEDVVATHATFGELRPSDGEIALFTTMDDSKLMLLYFQWGSTPHELTQTAVDNGLWVQGGYGPSSSNATRLFKVPETGLWLFDEP